MKVLLLLALASAAWALTCVSSNPSLLKACEQVAPKVEALWGRADATVALKFGDSNYASGVPGSHEYRVVLKELNLCTLAHELTHVIEMERGAYEPRWFAEGLAELTCYLLYPDLYRRTGYPEWVEKGYGAWSPYFFGLTVLYYLYSRGEDVWEAKNLSLYEAAEVFAKALEEGATPFGVKPSQPALGYVRLRGGWAYGGLPSGDYWKFGKVEVFYGPGAVEYLPFLVPPLPPSWLRSCGSAARRWVRGGRRFTWSAPTSGSLGNRKRSR